MNEHNGINLVVIYLAANYIETSINALSSTSLKNIYMSLMFMFIALPAAYTRYSSNMTMPVIHFLKMTYYKHWNFLVADTCRKYQPFPLFFTFSVIVCLMVLNCHVLSVAFYELRESWGIVSITRIMLTCNVRCVQMIEYNKTRNSYSLMSTSRHMPINFDYALFLN